MSISRALLASWPEAELGAIESIEPITAGMSGAEVFAIKAARGEFVLRAQPREPGDYFTQQLQVLRRASAAGISPELVHVDERAGAVVSRRIAGLPLAAALADPRERDTMLQRVVESLRKLHGLDPAGMAARDPIPYVRAAWQAARVRPGFPAWAQQLGPTLDALAALLRRDTRRVVSHNDVNPGNILWDGKQAWLIDWEACGLGHPYYDLAALAVFLRLDEAKALALAAQHDAAPLEAPSRSTLFALRRLVGLLSGLDLLGAVSDLNVRVCATISEAPSLADCYSALQNGEWTLRTPYGSASMGLALLALGCAEAGSGTTLA